MNSKPAIIIALTLTLVGASFVNTSNCVSQPVQQKEGPMFLFRVLMRRMEMQEITAEVHVEFMNMPYNLTPPSLMVQVEQMQEYGGESDKIEMQANGNNYGGTQTMTFHPRGNTEFYPLDGYALNFTFTSRLLGNLIDDTNTKCEIRCMIPGLDEYKESGTSEDRFDAITESISEESFPQVQLNTKVYLQRGFSSQLVLSVLFISYLLLGSLLLIKPDKLEQRLSACLTLFLFAISFTFTVQVPTAQARATFAETLTFMLLIGAGLLSVLSVIEKTLFEAQPRLEVLQYPIEGVVLILLSFTLQTQISHFIGMSGGYLWIRNLGTTLIAFSAVLIAAILYGYVSKTVLFIIRRRKNS
jgi:hypothetical protein